MSTTEGEVVHLNAILSASVELYLESAHSLDGRIALIHEALDKLKLEEGRAFDLTFELLNAAFKVNFHLHGFFGIHVYAYTLPQDEVQ